MDRFLIRALIAAIGLWVADGLIDGISFDSGAWLLVAAIVLGILNAVVRPLAVILTLPITLITLGLFLLVLNAGMLAMAGWMLPGFHIAGFWPAFWGAIVVSVVSGVGSWFFGPAGRVEVTIRRD
ncbi:MAG: phage holin family protein [Chromatiales bacterium]|jgi:putative membrane protein|nr:MAG: phage holin family protein [Chromatiales bacterium]